VRVATDELRIERERLEAAQRPWVIPVGGSGWSRGTDEYAGRWAEVIPAVNAGPGAAVNIRGRLQLTGLGGQFVDIVPTGLAAGEERDLALSWMAPLTDGWSDARGALVYEDVSGQAWRTDFLVRVAGFRSFEVTGSGTVEEYGSLEDAPP
jgi:hypothetical protein